MELGKIKASVIDRFNVHVLGEGKQTIVFAHGLGCSQIMWRYIYPAFQNDYKIVLFDYLASGESMLDQYSQPKYDSLEGHADDIVEIIRALKLEKVIYVGHSMSSMLGMLASFKAPELFEQLIMIAPSPRYINDKEYTGGFDRIEIDSILELMESSIDNWAEIFTPKVMGSTVATELSEELRSSFCKINHRITYNIAAQIFRSDFRKQLENITVPTLILQGSNDIVVPMVVGEYMHEKIKNSTLYVMKAAGHYAHLTAPKETVQLIKKYLDSKKEL